MGIDQTGTGERAAINSRAGVARQRKGDVIRKTLTTPSAREQQCSEQAGEHAMRRVGTGIEVHGRGLGCGHGIEVVHFVVVRGGRSYPGSVYPG